MDKILKDFMILRTFNKKEVDGKFSYLLENICFYYLKTLSDYMYSVELDGTKYNSFCGNVFNRVKESLINARRSNNLEEFEESVLDCINYTEEIAIKAHKKLDFLGDTPEDPQIYFDLVDNLPEIYEKFYKRARKFSKRKRGK